ncbi:hypothetical protein MCT03_18195 [Vibrio aestuarianus]|nr:hypothetical protein [Vibrio aestuarianus]
MKFWLVTEVLLFVFFIYVFSDVNYDVTHNFLYSVVVMLVSAVTVYLLFAMRFIRLKSRKQTRVDNNTFKQYGAMKTRWYEKYSKPTVAFYLWVAITGLISIVDRTIDRDERVISGLTLLESKLTKIGKSRAALIVVSEGGKTITCRSYNYHIIEKDLRVTVSLIYSKTLLGFEKINCQLDLVDE